MAKQILTDILVHINGFDISAICNALSLESVTDEVEVTTYGLEYRQHIAGEAQTEINLDLILGVDGSATVTGTEVVTPVLTGATAYWNGLLFDALHTSEDTAIIDIAPHTAVPAVTNPWTTATCRLMDWVALSAEVGGPPTGSLRLLSTGATTVAYA